MTDGTDRNAPGSSGAPRSSRDSPLLAALTPAERDRLLADATPIGWRRGEVAEDPTNATDRFYVLTEGRIRVVRDHPTSPREVTLYLLGPGDGFDMFALLEGREHGVRRVALDTCHALSVSGVVLRSMLGSSPALQLALHDGLSARIRALEDLAEDLVLYATPTRLARLILRHTDPDDPDGTNLLTGLSDEVLATMIGSVRSVVNRHLQRLRREGILDPSGTHAVRDLKRLSELCDARLSQRPR